jgi:sorbose reductase
VTDAKLVQSSVDRVVAEFNGRLDIFVANAGIFPESGPILDLEIDNYRGAMAGNLDSVFYSARAAGKHWRRQKRDGTDLAGNRLEGFSYGSFVATASLAGGHIVEKPDLAAAYSVAKAGVIQLCRSCDTSSTLGDLLLTELHRQIFGGGMDPVCADQLCLPRHHHHAHN